MTSAARESAVHGAAGRRARIDQAADLQRPAASARSRMTANTRHLSEIDRRSTFVHGAGAAEDDMGLVILAVARAKEGDGSALRFLYTRYYEDVRRYVKSILRDHHEAEDVTQGVFLKLMFVVQGYEPRGVPFAAWLLRVARNAAVDNLRAKRTVPTENVRLSDDARDQTAFEHREVLKDALARLPHEQREVVVLRYVAGLAPREIAELLHKTHSSVHGLQHRGRQALKAALEEVGSKPLTA